MIKFIQTTQETKSLSLSDVDENQFFINHAGALCQKTSYDSYSHIALADGTPHGVTYSEREEDEKIQTILPKTSKIEFP